MTAIDTLAELEERLSQPTPALVAACRDLPGDIIVLGVAGKMGPTLARMAQRASAATGTKRRIIGVARFSAAGQEANLQRHGIETIKADLLDRDAVQRLPDAPNVIFMAGQKFGTEQGPELTWAMNTLVPSYAAEKYARSRIVVFSTGCVYPLVRVDSGGSREEDELCPQGDYSNSCVGRERIFSFFSQKNGTRLAMFRLFYAIDLRYGVLLDVARQVWEGRPVDVTMGYINVIWQQDANAFALQCLAHAASPPCLLNVTGPDLIAVRALAMRFGELLGKPAIITGHEAPTATCGNTTKARQLFGPPTVSLEEMLQWVAAWVRQGGVTINKPTHYEVRDGRF